MTLVRFLLVRLVTGVLGLLVFASATWLLSVWLIPGDFTSNFGGGINAEQREAIEVALGLDRPLLEQYLAFIGGLLRLDLAIHSESHSPPPARSSKPGHQ